MAASGASGAGLAALRAAETLVAEQAGTAATAEKTAVETEGVKVAVATAAA